MPVRDTLIFDCTREDGAYKITSGGRTLVDQIKSATQARRLLNAYEAGALLAGATVASTMPREVRSARYA